MCSTVLGLTEYKGLPSIRAYRVYGKGLPLVGLTVTLRLRPGCLCRWHFNSKLKIIDLNNNFQQVKIPSYLNVYFAVHARFAATAPLPSAYNDMGPREPARSCDIAQRMEC